MDAIREYLNNLFMSMPETPAVLRAKAELLEMMEDKYEELVREGKSEKEAVGTVLSEFGNLEELAEELGIDEYLKKNQTTPEEGGQNDTEKMTKTKAFQKKTEYHWSFENAKDYVDYSWKHAIYIAIGVMLCIWSPYLDSVLSDVGTGGYIHEMIADAIGTVCMFLFIAVAVGLFVGASGLKKRYGNITRYRIFLDEKARRYILARQDKDEQTRLYMRIAGVSLCIFSVVPSSVNYFDNVILSAILDSSVLVIVGIGVLFLVMSASVGNRYSELKRAIVEGSDDLNIDRVSDEFRMDGKGKRTMPIAVVIILIFVAFSVVAGSIILGLMMFKPDSSQIEEKAAISEEYDISDINKIVVDLDFGGLNVEMADTDKIQYQYNGATRRMPVVTNENGVFRVKEKSKGGFFNFSFFGFNFWNNNGGNRTATIVIPSGRTDIDYEINADAGSVKMKNISGGRLELDVDAGNIEGSGCTFQEKSLVDVDAGSVNFKDCRFSQLEGDVDTGNFEYRSTLPLSYYNMDLDADVGSITLNGQKMSSSYKASAQNDSAEGNYSLKIDVDMGKIDISEDTAVAQ